MSNAKASNYLNNKKKKLAKERRSVIRKELIEYVLPQENRQLASRSVSGLSRLQEGTSVPPKINQVPRTNRHNNNNAKAKDPEPMTVDEGQPLQDERHDAQPAAPRDSNSNSAPKNSSNPIDGADDLRTWMKDMMDGMEARMNKKITELQTSINVRFKEMSEKLGEIEKRRKADVVKQKAVQYESIVLSWIGLQVREWYGCTSRGIYGGAHPTNKTPSYEQAFEETEATFMGDDRQLFRDLNAAVKDKEQFTMFSELEYNGLGTAVDPNVPGNLSPNAFVSPSKRGAAAGDNLIVIVEMTNKNLRPSAHIIRTFVNYVENHGSSPNILDNLQNRLGHQKNKSSPMSDQDFAYLRNLLLKLVQLEQQITLQLHRYKDTDPVLDSLAAVRNRIRCGLVSSEEPAEETLTTLFESPAITRALYNLRCLFVEGHFKTTRYKLNYEAYV